MRNLAKIFLLFFVAASATTIIACMLSKSGLPAAQPVGEMHADDFSHILRTHFCTVIGIASLVFFISASLTVSFFYAYRIRLIADRNLSILSMMPARIFIMDRDENLLYVHIHEDDPIPNPHVKKLREIENIDHEKMSKIFKDVFETRKSATVEYDYNGIKRIMRIAPIPDKIYGKEAIIWMSHSNSEFQDVRKFWDIVMNSVPFNFYAKDAANDFRYILCNDEFAKFLDRPKEQIIGSTDFELHGREKAEGVLEADKTVMARGIGIECTEDIVDARGRSRIVRTVKKPFVGVDGRRMLFSVSVDVTELEESKRMEAEHRGLLQALLDNLRIGRQIPMLSAKVAKRG